MEGYRCRPMIMMTMTHWESLIDWVEWTSLSYEAWTMKYIGRVVHWHDWGSMVSCITQGALHQRSFTIMGYLLRTVNHGCLGFLQKPTVQACILPKSSINHPPQPNRVSHKISWKSNHAAMFLTYSFCLQKAITQVGARNIQYWRIQRDTTKHIWLVGSGIHMKIMHWCHITDIANSSF